MSTEGLSGEPIRIVLERTNCTFTEATLFKSGSMVLKRYCCEPTVNDAFVVDLRLAELRSLAKVLAEFGGSLAQEVTNCFMDQGDQVIPQAPKVMSPPMSANVPVRTNEHLSVYMRAKMIWENREKGSLSQDTALLLLSDLKKHHIVPEWDYEMHAAECQRCLPEWFSV